MDLDIEYDTEVNAAYISLIEIEPGDISCSSNSVQAKDCPGQVNLDFDSSGRLVGIEVLNASSILHQNLLLKTKYSG